MPQINEFSWLMFSLKFLFLMMIISFFMVNMSFYKFVNSMNSMKLYFKIIK